MSLLSVLKDKLLALPLVRRFQGHLAAQGHTPEESEKGALVAAVVALVLVVVLFEVLLLGVARTLLGDLSQAVRENPFQAFLVTTLAALLGLALWFRSMGRRESERKAEKLKSFREGERLKEKIEAVRRGAMGHFKEAFEGVLTRKRPDLSVKDVHVTDASPRIRFHAQKRSVSDGNLDKNYLAFRDRLFEDTREVLATAFEVAPNAPVVTVDALLNFINRKAQYYDGPVLSVRASRDTWQSIDSSEPDALHALSALEIRYNDGSEVEAHPDVESRHHRVIERLRAEGPKWEGRYETASFTESDDWREAADPPDLFVTELSDRSDAENLSLRDFEQVVVKTLRKHGFTVPKARTAPGNQLEFLAYHAHPLLGGSCLVWARQIKPGVRVPLEGAERLDGRVRDEARQRGIYLVTGSFTEEAFFKGQKMGLVLADRLKFLEWVKWNADPAVRLDAYGAVRRVALDPTVDLSALSVPVLQDLMEGLLGNLGFNVQRLNRMQGGAVRAVVEHAHPILGGKSAVLAKSFPERQAVDEETVREFIRVMESEFCARGFLFLSAYLTPKARALAASSGITAVERHGWYNLLELFKAPSA